MRRVIVGESPDGTSKIVGEDVAAIFAFDANESRRDPHDRQAQRLQAVPPNVGAGEVVVAELWSTDAAPRYGDTTDLTAEMVNWDVETNMGRLRWRVCIYGPHRSVGIHTTKTLDMDVVLAGEVDLLLDQGDVHLVPGDAVIIPGVRHGWRTGEVGCTLAVTMIGLAYD